MSKIACILDRVLDHYLTSEERWARGWFARDAAYQQVHATSPRAVKWCALGACEAALHDCNAGMDDYYATVNLLDSVVPVRGGSSIVQLNDHHAKSLQEVRHAFLNARKKLANQEAKK